MAKVRRAYTIEEQQAIVEFRNKGYQFTQIGKLLDRSALSVAKKYREITHNNYEYSCRDFKYRLTPTEEKVISLMCKGLDDNEKVIYVFGINITFLFFFGSYISVYFLTNFLL